MIDHYNFSIWAKSVILLVTLTMLCVAFQLCFYRLGLRNANTQTNISTPGGFKNIAKHIAIQELNKGWTVVTQFLPPNPAVCFSLLEWQEWRCNSTHTISAGTLLRSTFGTKVIWVKSFLVILIDLLSLASSEYTILPTLPVKEGGKSLKHRSREPEENEKLIANNQMNIENTESTPKKTILTF